MSSEILEAVPVLTRLLNHEDEMVRDFARRALKKSKIGPDEEEATRQLLNFLHRATQASESGFGYVIPPRFAFGHLSRLDLTYIDYALEVFNEPGPTVSNITDEQLKLIARLPRLSSLVLADSCVTDAGLRHLERHPGLASLSLIRNTKVKGPGLPFFATLPKLENLVIRDRPLTAEGWRKPLPFSSGNTTSSS
jgi:hypothetical protein